MTWPDAFFAVSVIAALLIIVIAAIWRMER